MPSAAAITQVRRFNEKNLDLYAYALSDQGQKQRRAMGLPPVQSIRSATEAEIVEIAEALDAGAVLSPRLWVETFKVREAADTVQFLKAA